MTITNTYIYSYKVIGHSRQSISLLGCFSKRSERWWRSRQGCAALPTPLLCMYFIGTVIKCIELYANVEARNHQVGNLPCIS